LQFSRHRRLRQSPNLRALVSETTLTASDFIYPLFIVEKDGVKEEVSSMPGVYQLSLDRLEEEINTLDELGIRAVILFGVPNEKDDIGTGAYATEGIVQRATRQIKTTHPDMLVVADTCLCEYTSHGHCGVIEGEEVDNDASL